MRPVVVALAALSCLAAVPAAAQGIELDRPAPEERFARPTTDLVAVGTSVFFPTAPAGTANEGTCTVENTSSVPVRVRLEAEIVYADGRVGRLSQLGDPGVLEPDGGFELSIFFVIPPDAPLGDTQFVCSVRAQSVVSRRQQEREISISRFEIIAP